MAEAQHQFNPKLLMYYLAGVGGNLGGKGSWQEEMGNITKQQMASENYMGMMQKLLAGMPAGAKLTGDRDNVTMKMPTGALGSVGKKEMDPNGMSLGEPDFGGGDGGVGTTQPVNAATAPTPSMKDALNPSSSPQGVTGADLVGLTPKDISTALGIRLTAEDLQSKKLSRISNMLYQQNLINEGQSRTNLAWSKHMQEWDAKGPLTVPGLGKLSLKEWQSLPTETRAYSYYVYDERKSGNEPLGYQEWIMSSDPTSIQQIYELAKVDEEFKKFAFAYKKAGSTNINISPEKRAEGTAIGKQKAKFSDPEYIIKLEKSLTKGNRVASAQIRAKTEEIARTRGIDPTKAREYAVRLAVLKELESQIKRLYKNKTVVFKGDGWYIDGELVVRSPYAK